MSVGEYCVRDVVVADAHMSVPELARLMRSYHVGDIVVVEERGGERVPEGIVTDRDLVVEVLAEEVDLNAVTAADIMSADLLVVGEGDDLWETVERMRDRGVRRAPVVNQRGGLEGILTVDDLIDLLAEQMSDLVQLFRREQRREQATRTVP
ncbi:MAG: CBS domain-containing protein [Gammaproteobacteria bacterium]|nr:CBS domain-containing protein [Gammaproteobacteria bacterium]NIR99080.1 CBS domain-containing protein [Gammaproteobacteria bacterium]NIT64712.1 CBS domain-containing protein [Gammaproteobacteria bacterium]NIV21670.1 CBS domain-containing protein [Gammaproteobacteria bacterium]NIX10632.1 CBS domain-containing protein [Gammaproteobacteria bacterium]